MCLGIPMQIVEIMNNHMARAEAMGVKRPVRIDIVPGVAVGDYVLIHAGFAMQVIATEDALDRMQYLEKILVKLEEEK